HHLGADDPHRYGPRLTGGGSPRPPSSQRPSDTVSSSFWTASGNEARAGPVGPAPPPAIGAGVGVTRATASSTRPTAAHSIQAPSAVVPSAARMITRHER